MTRSMTRWVLTGFMALAAMGTVATLDVGTATAQEAPSLSPFAGSWSGTWSIAGHGVGTFDWTISGAGRITGRVFNATSGRSGTVRGHVGADGDLMMLGFAPADMPGDGGGNGFAFQGTAVIDGDGRLVVSATRTSLDRTLVAILERN